MAKDKKAVLIYADWIHTFNLLNNEQAGKLVKHLFAYVNDENPTSEDKLVEIAFEPMKQALKRDLRKYEVIVEKRSQAGKISAERRKQEQTNSTNVEAVKQTPTNSTVNVNDNVNDNVIVINKKKEIPPNKEDLNNFFNLEGSPEEAENFFNYYASNGWRVGKNLMKDWKAAAKGWITRSKTYTNQTNGKQAVNNTQSRFDKFIG
jgi:hypothetical protein